MFKSAENLRLAAEMRALQRVAEPWRRSRTTWFDGTPEALEARLAATERVLTHARSGLTTAHLALAGEAGAARAELLAAKHRLLTDFLDDGARVFRGSRRVTGEDEFIDCPYCGAEAHAAEFSGGHCPTCGRANYELEHFMAGRRLAGDGMSYEDTMKHIDDTLAAGDPDALDDLTQRKALNLVKGWMGRYLGQGQDEDEDVPSGQRAYESGSGLKLHPAWSPTWQDPITGEMNEEHPRPAIMHEGYPGWADEASFDEDLNEQLRQIGVEAGNWYGNTLSLYPYREWSIPPTATAMIPRSSGITTRTAGDDDFDEGY